MRLATRARPRNTYAIHAGALLELYVTGSYVVPVASKPVVFVGTIHDVKETTGCVILLTSTGLIWLDRDTADDWFNLGLMNVISE